ncbi:hypothetical protein BC938DRAFT_482327 [Jimgerdemannia flammicorona]|uniref:UDP-glucose:Glyco protein glucosyltransferase-domain-containing protein n=1 Tax=Jimgerdemannia flammicorona TaxID=994334 RepID=A0A433QWD6_9FUNG|nr:hypothetical protein BC938DRAFT_482327 [Jimgerdemannia flammicorona]
MVNLSRGLRGPSAVAAVAAVALVVITCAFTVRANRSPPIQLQLITPWEGSHLLLEILESVAVENKTAYFPLLTDLTSPAFFAEFTTPKVFYEAALNVVSEKGYLRSLISLALTKVALSLHATAPAIQAYYHYYNNSILPGKLNASGAQFDPSCEIWAEFDGHQACTVATLAALLDVASPATVQPTRLLPFDHILRPVNARADSPIVIVYADITAASFPVFHEYLTEKVESTGVTYVLRYKPPSTKGGPLYLTGYGVELALKSTDYLVIDDRKVDGMFVGSMWERDVALIYDDASTSETLVDAETRTRIQEHLFDDEIPEIKPLKANEIRELGLKTAQFVLDSPSSLGSLVQLSQDFLRYAHSIAQLELNDTVHDEVQKNQNSVVEGGINALWLNGLTVGVQEINPFRPSHLASDNYLPFLPTIPYPPFLHSILRLLRREHQIVRSLTSLGMTPSTSIALVSSPLLVPAAAVQGAAPEGVFDVRDTSPDGTVVLWWNDLEKDKRYARWPRNLFELLRPSYPGQMRQLGLNLYNVLFVRDMSHPAVINNLVEDVQAFVKNGYPIRFGLVPLVDDKDDNADATIMAKLIHYYVSEFGRGQVMKFLQAVSIPVRYPRPIPFIGSVTYHSDLHPPSQVITELDPTTKTIRPAAERAFRSSAPTTSTKSGESAKTFDEIMTAYADHVAEVRRFLKRVGASSRTDGNGLMFVNGKVYDFEDELYIGEITADQTDIYEYLLSLPHVAQRRNPYVYVSDARPLKVLDLTAGGPLVDIVGYVQPESIEESPLASVWVVANFDSVEGAKLGLEALTNVEASKKTRATLLHNPAAPALTVLKLHDGTNVKFSDIVYRALHGESAKRISLADLKQIFEIVTTFEEDELTTNPALTEQVKAMYGSPVTELITQGYAEKWAAIGRGLADMELAGDFAGVLVNGRVAGPIPADVDFASDDFELLVHLELQKRIEPARNAILALNLSLVENDVSEKVDPNFLLKASSILGAVASSAAPVGIFGDGKEKPRGRPYMSMNGEHTRVVKGDKDSACYHIGAIIDPLSEYAQKTAAILETLSKIDGVYMEIYLNPVQALTELPLKRFYRYVFDDSLHFDASEAIERPSAYFSNVPEDPLLTLGMDVISPWLVRPVVADQDLDNIRLAKLDPKQRVKGVTAVIELRNILIEGHCRDMTINGPPRGLQFVLGTASYPALVDTIVMANLGYLQLKANPGVFELSLREGRSRELYDIESVGSEGWTSRSVEEIGYDVVLNTFEGVVIYPRVTKKPGMEREELLEDAEEEEQSEDGGIWGSIKSKIWGLQEAKQVVQKTTQAEINIFSVASGHLYERFLSIMILSVLRHTKSTVKFWFIENFLSPYFMVRVSGSLDFIPQMATEYGFEYELVTYKWPSWLRGQTEKQRTIWGYKILFLDVLFPLDLDKVIFVDADQIVRTDLKELVDMDLKGAPYGYTPFCDSRSEMNGFRFWTQGYWQQHLAGKPYHISALYVIDLVRFRQMAAGDRLRGQYQALSADPNSLANLDQDLPNNMQHQVPIFSLPQDWLWCETWCSDESLKTAKTIDLCNNPLTKEPKLDRARRQIPEWEEYDNEAEALRRRVLVKKEIKPASQAAEVMVEKIEVEEKVTKEEKVRNEL